MAWEHLPDRLSKITTVWTELREAQAGTGEAAAGAQQAVMQRYGGAVYRYLLAVLRDPAAAEDLTQEFALGLVRGAYRHADPGRGRFRDYVKTVLFHLVSEYRDKQRRLARAVPLGPAEEPATDAGEEQRFTEAWREALLERVWQALAAVHPDLYTVLRLRAAHPDLPSAELSRRLGPALGRVMTADAVRQALRRARTLFAELLVQEVDRSLQRPGVEEVQSELAALGLLEYVRPALKGGGTGG